MRQASGDELVRDPLATIIWSDPQEEEMQALTWTSRLTCPVLRIQLAQEVEDRIELRAQVFHAHGKGARRVFGEQHPDHLARLGGSGHSREPLDRRFCTKQPDESLELSRCQANCNGRRIVVREYFAKQACHLACVFLAVDAVIDHPLT